MSRWSAAGLLILSVPLALVVGSLSPIGEVGLLIMVGAFVRVARAVPGFVGGAFRGALAGTLAGIAVLGGGFRLAMRIVAITEPSRTPEFTVEGTVFIVVGLGLMFGAVSGAYLGGIRHLLELGPASIAVIATFAIFPILFGDSEVRAEFFELGVGAWLNLPMFTSVVFAYGWAQYAIEARLRRRVDVRMAESIGVEPAPVP